MNLLTRTVESKATVVELNRPPRWKIVRQLPPGATRTTQVQDRIKNFAQIDAARASARFGRWYRRLDQSPLFVRQVRRVRNPFHAHSYRQKGAFSHTF